MKLKHLTLRYTHAELQRMEADLQGRGRAVLEATETLETVLTQGGLIFGRRLAAHETSVEVKPDGSYEAPLLDIEFPTNDMTTFVPIVHSTIDVGMVADVEVDGTPEELPPAGAEFTVDVKVLVRP